MPIPEGWSEFKTKDIKVSEGKGGVREISYMPTKPDRRSPSEDQKARQGKRFADNTPILVISDIFREPIPGLGSIVQLKDLSQKRITVAVRKMLRGEFGHFHVQVSCTANFQDGVWIGRCEVDGNSYQYTVR